MTPMPAPSPGRGRRLAILLAAGIALVFVALAAGFLYTGGVWGCPSQAELERPRSPKEVASAFAVEGVQLTRTRWPGVIPWSGAYRNALAYRHTTPRAALFVVVCEARCVNAPPGLREERIGVGGGRRQHLRQFSTLGNNLAVFVTDEDGHSGRQLHARLRQVLNELDAAVPYGSRCYIQ